MLSNKKVNEINDLRDSTEEKVMRKVWLKIRLFFSKFKRKKKDYNKGKIYPLW